MRFKQVNQFIATKVSPLACHYNPETGKSSASQRNCFCVLQKALYCKKTNQQTESNPEKHIDLHYQSQ